MLSLFSFILASSMEKRNKSLKLSAFSESNELLLNAVLALNATQLVNAALGEPSSHVATSLHQPCGKPGVFQKDFMGNEREVYIDSCGSSPYAYSKDDYEIVGFGVDQLERKLDSYIQEEDNLSTYLKKYEEAVNRMKNATEKAGKWQEQSVDRISDLKGQDHDDSFGEIIEEISSTSNDKVALLKGQIEAKSIRTEAIRDLVRFHLNKHKRATKELKEQLKMMKVDPNGEPIVPAEEFGPNSFWYTVRGRSGAHPTAEKAIVGLLSVYSIYAFGKILTLASK